MTFRVVGSSSLARLLDAAADELGAAPLPPHLDEWIVVPSAGMRRWLTLELADRWGIAAALQTPFPADAIGRLAALFLGDASNDEFSRDALVWRAFGMLPRLGHEAVDRYLVGDGDGIKRYGLAKRLGRTLREMQSTRVDVLGAWERGEDCFVDEQSGDARAGLADVEAWQAELWRRVVAAAPGVPPSHRLQALVERLRGPVGAPPPGLPARLTLFAVGAMAPTFVDAFAALGRWIDVTAFVVDPLVEARRPSALVASLGRQGADFRRALREVADVTEGAPVERAEPSTTLGVLQQAIRGLPVDRGPLPDRDSLTLHRCHTPLREIEVVHDLVLAALTSDRSLRPHDVVVLLPDVELYAPYVDAVFGRRHRGLPDLPYHVADRMPQVRPLIQAVLRTLDVIVGRFEVGDVLGLLEEPSIRRRFGMSEGDAGIARRHALDASIRWGVDGAHRARFGQPDDDTLTWRQGLDRLMLGLAVGPHDGLVDGCLPTAGDTIGDVDALGRFAAFVEALCARADDVDVARAPEAWADWLAQLVADLVEPADDDEREDRRALLAAFAALGEAGGRGAAELSIAVVRAWLEDAVGDEGFGGGFLTGRISFAALRPLRTIPFRVVIVCGLDDATFPRRSRSTPFDLIAARPRRGDRDDRADDRELFLEVVLAAADRLAITWPGRSPRDDHERAVSVCVSELLEELDRVFVPDDDGRAPGALLTSSRGLQRHSPSEFRHDLHPRGHSLEALDVARALVAKGGVGGAVPPFAVEPLTLDAGELVLDLEQLVRAWSEAPRSFFRESLDVDLKEWVDELAEREPLVQSGLDRYHGGDALLEHLLRGRPARDADDERAILRQLGVLPPDVRGDLDHADVLATLDAIVERLGALPSRAPEAVSLRGEGWRVAGRIDGLAPDALKVVRAGRVKDKTRVQAWVRHVVLGAWAAEHPERGLPTTTRLVGSDTAETLKPLRDARAVLEDLMAGAREMRVAPQPLFEHASRAYVEAEDEPLVAARKAFASRRGAWSAAGDVEDVHVALAFRDRPQLETGAWLAHEPRFVALSQRLWGPLLEHLEPDADS